MGMELTTLQNSANHDNDNVSMSHTREAMSKKLQPLSHPASLGPRATRKVRREWCRGALHDQLSTENLLDGGWPTPPHELSRAVQRLSPAPRTESGEAARREAGPSWLGLRDILCTHRREPQHTCSGLSSLSTTGTAVTRKARTMSW